VNNAGIFLDSDAFPLTRETMEKTLQVNLIGVIELTQLLLPQISPSGRIISLSSGLGSITGNPDDYKPAYRISKSAINMFTRSLAHALSGKGIAVASVDPGWVRTDMGGPSAPRDPSEPAEEIYRLATDPIESGFFWHRGRQREW
jgi:NAD(P)-dependent dehydrogenase (short-subunit alcohol dehydrogenase family)